MLIEVIGNDYSEGMLDASKLDQMIQLGRIAAFRRSSGWVVVGSQPIRIRKSRYSGPERRAAKRMSYLPVKNSRRHRIFS